MAVWQKDVMALWPGNPNFVSTDALVYTFAETQERVTAGA